MRTNRGFTLIEMVVVTALMAVILVPVYRVLSHGSKAAINGVNRTGIVLEGQQILGQIKDDLSKSYLVFKEGKQNTISRIFTTSSSPGEMLYSFFTFNGGKYDQEVVPTTSGNISYRRLNRVEYRLISHANSPYKTLERTIILHPKNHSFGTKNTLTKVLSDKVDYFGIKAVSRTSCGETRAFFRISLLLFDRKESGNVKKLVNKTTGKVNTSNAFIADFSGVIVNPVLFNVFVNNVGLNRNWYTDAQTP